MKTGMLKLISAVLICAMMAFTLASCGLIEDIFGGDEDDCVHRDANDDGRCELCGAEFSDGDEWRESRGLEFASNDDGTAVVKGIGSCKDEDIVIPATTPDGEAVVGIAASAFYDCDELTSVVIPTGVVSIGGWAFYGCKSLSSLTLPETLRSIDGAAFWGCAGLVTLSLPDSLTAVGNGAFYDCRGLTTLEIGSGLSELGDYALELCFGLESISVDEGNSSYKSVDGNLYTKDGSVLLKYATGKTATAFSIPSGVVTVGDDAFAYSRSLVSVSFPTSVTVIGVSAFSGCQSLSSVILPDSVSVIGASAFHGCSSLTSVTFGSGVESIGPWVFANCSSLSEVTFAETDGWSVFSVDIAETAIPAAELADATLAISYLKQTYNGCSWVRK